MQAHAGPCRPCRSCRSMQVLQAHAGPCRPGSCQKLFQSEPSVAHRTGHIEDLVCRFCVCVMAFAWLRQWRTSIASSFLSVCTHARPCRDVLFQVCSIPRRKGIAKTWRLREAFTKSPQKATRGLKHKWVWQDPGMDIICMRVVASCQI
jgi:hypothetical protein